MRILVTGGAGFLGSHVVDRLLAEGHRVWVADDLSTGMEENLREGARFLRMDIRQPLDAVFQLVRPEVVVHLAAQVSVGASLTDPHTDLSTNVGGTVNVMTAAARAGVAKVIAVSSAAVYGMPQSMPLREESPTGALSPYGLSKLAGEQYIRLLGQTLGVPYLILRPANIYGPRQTTQGEGAVVPAFLSRFMRGENPVIHGTGRQTRDFVYVTDVARAIVQGLDRAEGLTLNVSTGEATAIVELWGLLAEGLGWTQGPVFGPAREGDIPDSVMANDLARRHLAWQPDVRLACGLEETIRWAQGGALLAERTRRAPA